MIPYSLWMLAMGTVMVILWVALGLPLGPGASAGYTL